MIAADLLSHVLAVDSELRFGAETALVSVSSGATAATRSRMHQALVGLPHAVVEVDRPPRGVVRGLVGHKDGKTWPIGSHGDVAWIRDNTASGLAITSAIPPIFQEYATIVIPNDDELRRASDSALLRLLVAHTLEQPWWLGFLDTGAHDVVFDHAPVVTLYAGWPYVLVEAGPLQAGGWRANDPWRGGLPDLIFPSDRTWLVSMLWDDDWRCVGGAASLIRALLADPALACRSVTTDGDVTPPGMFSR